MAVTDAEQRAGAFQSAVSRSRLLAGAREKSVDKASPARIIRVPFADDDCFDSRLFSLTNGAILQFPSESSRSVRSLRNMTAQLLQDAAKVIPNQQLLINVVSKRVRQLGIGHRPLVEATPSPPSPISRSRKSSLAS